MTTTAKFTSEASKTAESATIAPAQLAPGHERRLGRLPRTPQPPVRSCVQGRLATFAAALVITGAGLSVLPVAASAATHASAGNKDTVGCSAAPSACGYPDASNTGVPVTSAASLKRVPGQVSKGKGWHFNPGGWVQVTGNGAVLSGLYIPYTVNVSASNVTLQNDLITSGGPNSYGVTLRRTSNVTIENSTISGLDTGAGRLMVGVKDVYGNSANLQVLNNNIADTATGVQVEQGLIQGNYIHSMGFLPGDHINGVTSNGGIGGLLTIQHNTILVDHDQTDAVGLFEDFGAQANRVITGNLLAGGSYAVYGGQSASGAPTQNITITNNRFGSTGYPQGGRYGPVTAYNPAGSGDAFAGNIWDATNAAVPSP